MKYNLIALCCAVLLAAGLAVNAGTLIPDTDSDGVFTYDNNWSVGIGYAGDNCPEHFNPAQADADWDGYGQACDPNYDQTGTVSAADFATFKASYGLKSGDTGYDEQTNHDCIGKVGAADFATFKAFYGGFQGPGSGCSGLDHCGAGLTCAMAGVSDLSVGFTTTNVVETSENITIPLTMYAPTLFSWPGDGVGGMQFTYMVSGPADGEPRAAIQGMTEDSWVDCDSWIDGALPEDWECLTLFEMKGPWGFYTIQFTGDECMELADAADLYAGLAQIAEVPWTISSAAPEGAIFLQQGSVGTFGLFDCDYDYIDRDDVSGPFYGAPGFIVTE